MGSGAKLLLGALLGLAVCGQAALGEQVEADRLGRIMAMGYDGQYLQVMSNVGLPLRGWPAIPGLAQADGVKYERSGGRRLWSGRVKVSPNSFARIEQALQEADGRAMLSVKVTAEADLDVEGAFLFVDLPIEAFAGGTAELLSGPQQVAAATMPASRPEERHFLSGTGTEVRVADAQGNRRFSMAFEDARRVSIQDMREWNADTYQVYVTIAPGPLRAGQTGSLTAALSLAGRGDRSPAAITLAPDRDLYRLDGFGGDYCFGIESPVTQYTLDNLNVRWARTEMTLAEWEPRNDNASPEQTDWDFLKSHDAPDSNLRREFLLAQQLQQRGIPCVVSVWRLPVWLYADPDEGREPHGRQVPEDKWPELLECLGSYLLYAREQYGVEPDLFSFNEPDYGVWVKFSPEEHWEAVKSIGAHFERLGLKTKLLLADAANPRSPGYAAPAAADPLALPCLGAVAFHSWGGAAPEQYAAWRDLSRRLGLPLLVTEVGVDANWRAVPLDSYRYALREVEMYQDLLRHAQPQGTMQWEFTSDYSLVDVDRSGQGAPRLTPTKRFWFAKHFCNLTPTPAMVVESACDNPMVRVSAMRGAAGGGFAVHVANLGSARQAVISGLPPGVLHLTRTSEAESFAALEPVTVPASGMLDVTLEPASLLTLTSER